MSRLKIFLLALLVTLPAMGADTEGQLWRQFLSQGKLGAKTRLWLEFQPRYGLTTGAFTTILLRPALGWQVTDAFSLWAGYAWTPLLKPTARDEHRAWLQGVVNLTPMGGTFSQRLRLEGRFIEGAAATAIRLRYMSRLAIPVATESALSAVFYDEVFLALNDASPVLVSGFDQNRAFLGLNYRFSPKVAVDFGYLCNVIDRAGTLPNRVNHVFMATLFHNFDLTSE